MKMTAIIPARYNSVRLPGKPLVMIKGRPLIQHTYEQVQSVHARTYVATDDVRIHDAVRDFGGKVIITSRDHVCGTDRCAEAARTLRLPNNDIVINVQCDQPMISIYSLMALAFSITNGHSIATLISSCHPWDYENPNAVKLTVTKDSKAKHFSRQRIAGGKNYYHIGAYAFVNAKLQELAFAVRTKTDTDLEQLRWLNAGEKIHCVYTSFRGVSIDTQEDLEHFIQTMQ